MFFWHRCAQIKGLHHVIQVVNFEWTYRSAVRTYDNHDRKMLIGAQDRVFFSQRCGSSY